MTPPLGRISRMVLDVIARHPFLDGQQLAICCNRALRRLRPHLLELVDYGYIGYVLWREPQEPRSRRYYYVLASGLRKLGITQSQRAEYSGFLMRVGANAKRYGANRSTWAQILRLNGFCTAVTTEARKRGLEIDWQAPPLPPFECNLSAPAHIFRQRTRDGYLVVCVFYIPESCRRASIAQQISQVLTWARLTCSEPDHIVLLLANGQHSPLDLHVRASMQQSRTRLSWARYRDAFQTPFGAVYRTENPESSDGTPITGDEIPHPGSGKVSSIPRAEPVSDALSAGEDDEDEADSWFDDEEEQDDDAWSEDMDDGTWGIVENPAAPGSGHEYASGPAAELASPPMRLIYEPPAPRLLTSWAEKRATILTCQAHAGDVVGYDPWGNIVAPVDGRVVFETNGDVFIIPSETEL